MNYKIGLIFIFFFVSGTLGSVHAQDPIASWELGWDTDMDGTYTLFLNDHDDIEDELKIFIDNQRIYDLNIELTIEWDSSEQIPIEISYDESITISGSTNETISISLKNENGYVYERSPNSTMIISITADEVALEQSTSSQNIEGDVAVPPVYELVPSVTSRGETLYPGSFIEYDFNIENNGNSDDAIDGPQYSIRSCPHLDIEGVEELDGQVIPVDQIHQVELKIIASNAHPDRTCEITLSIISSGNQLTSSVIFEVVVNAGEVASGNSNQDVGVNESGSNNSQSDLTESSSLPWMSTIEMLLAFSLATYFLYPKK